MGRAWSKKWRRMEGKCWKEIKQKDGKPKGMKRTAVYILMDAPNTLAHKPTAGLSLVH